jgi:tRNA A37 methylthiotransferase MiaB
VFVYSQEEGTPAGRRDDQIPLRTRRARAQRLRDLADAVGFARVAARVGTVEEVLIVERDEDEDEDAREAAAAGGVDSVAVAETAGAAEPGDTTEDVIGYPLLGRTQRQAPEVDGMIHLNRGSIGEVVSVRIVEAYCYDQDGKVIGASHA